MSNNHKCYDDSVLFCAACAPNTVGDFCQACFWGQTDRKHIWWCHQTKKCIHNIEQGENIVTTLKWFKEIEMWYCNVCKKYLYEELID